MKPAQTHKQLVELTRLFQTGRLIEARAVGKQLHAAEPRQPQVLAMLGAIHGQLGEFRDAEECYRALTALEPEAHMHHCYLGLALVMQQRLPEAAPVFARMLQLRPDFAEGHMQMGCLLRDLGQHEAAAGHLTRALQLVPGLTSAAVFLGNLRVFQGRLDEALACYEQALAQQPSHPDAVAGKVMLLERRGAKDAAWEALQPVLAEGRATPSVAIAYALLAPEFAAVEQATALLNDVLTRGGLAPSQQQELHFALGRLCDKARDYHTAFRHYAAGNRLAPLRFDVATLRAKVERIKQVFAADVVVAADAGPEGAPVPIFIVGMPRSGTSLVEQILASHPEVAAGGELEALADIERAAGDILGRGEPYPECLVGARPQDMAELAARYRATIADIAKGARYVTDKLPPNYERLGLIQRLFPEARIVHTERDPRDTCLSCYFQNFGNTHTYTTELRALGAVYGIYGDLMRHWHATLDVPILDIAYESLVTDPTTSVRRLLEFCGLPWQDACLEFHTAPRYVNTASYDQVRRPLYDSSVGRWRHYDRQLTELLEALSNDTR